MTILIQQFLPSNYADEELENRDMNKDGNVDLELFEEDPSGTPSIDVKNLRKVFKSITGKLGQSYYIR